MKPHWFIIGAQATAWPQVLTARQGAKLRRMAKGHSGVHAALCAQVSYSHCEESSSMLSKAGADAQAENQGKAAAVLANRPIKVRSWCLF